MMRIQLNQWHVVGLVQRKFALLALLVYGVAQDAPYLNVPSICREICMASVVIRKNWFVDMIYAVFIQPIVNFLLIGRSYKMTIFAGDSLAAIPALFFNGNPMFSKQPPNGAIRHIKHTSYANNRFSLFVQFKQFIMARQAWFAFIKSNATFWAGDIVLIKPMLDGAKVNIVNGGNIFVAKMFDMNHIVYFISCWLRNAAVKQSPSRRASFHFIGRHPTKHSPVTCVVASGNRAHRELLSVVQIFERVSIWLQYLPLFSFGIRRKSIVAQEEIYS